MKRFDAYVSNLAVLKTASEQDLTNEFIVGGIIDKFFVQFEPGWKVFKKLLAYEGDAVAASGSPRDIIKAAWRYFDFLDEEAWLQMLRDRNDLSHQYDAVRAQRFVRTVIDVYVPEFERVESGLRERYGKLLEQPDGAWAQ